LIFIRRILSGNGAVRIEENPQVLNLIMDRGMRGRGNGRAGGEMRRGKGKMKVKEGWKKTGILRI